MEESKKYTFEKLTPVDDCDISIYESAIDFAFDEKDIRNIAISGAYGAGKSSVLAAYKAKHKDIKFLHISLAHFQGNSDSSSSEDSSSPIKKNDSDSSSFKDSSHIKESVLEGKILNQLIHQIPAETIPQTNFRVKKSTSNKIVLGYTIAILVFLIALFHVLFFDGWSTFVNGLADGVVKKTLSLATNHFSLIFSGVLLFVFAGFFIFKLLVMQKNKSIFKKLSFQGNEIEIFAESNDSFFDKYLNEVLYLFENVDADVIVFEDMDRFDAHRIFERLREVNTLANIQRGKEGKKILRFFYLLRDDIFISKDRTKFFDYIIPVVPVVDSSNSYNQFISHLKKNDLFAKFDEGFLQGISLYVDDMRLLKNICNEFLIYYNRLNTTELDYNKMFALITYKNLFPRDFNDLQLNRGFVFSLFDKKSNFLKERVDELRSAIQAKRERITNAKQEIAQSPIELNLIFDPKRRGYQHILNNANQAEYNRRLDLLKFQKEGIIEELQEEITIDEKKIRSLENAPLSSIITRENIDHIFSLTVTNEIGEETTFNEIKANEYFPLVKYLVRNGYIDETYADYMTYFYEDSLSRIDKIYLRSVTDKKAKPYNYELRSPEMVFRRLHAIDFDQEETLNFMLCDYLLSAQSTSQHLLHLISQLRNVKNIAYIAQFFDSTANMPAFIQIFNMQWPSLFVDMQGTDGFNQKQLRLFSIYTLYYTNQATLDTINENEVLTKYINGSKDYLSIDDPQIDKLITAFKQLKVSFPEIDYEQANKDLFWAVYENDLYELNFENIALFLERLWGIDAIEEIKHKSYTIISGDSDSPLYKRIEGNMPDYLAILLEKCDGKISDEESVVISLLNRSDIDVAGKEEYIKYLDTKLHDLSAFTDHSIWSQLLDSSELVCSEHNILSYFGEKQEVDSSLIGYINNADQSLNFSSQNIDIAEETRTALFDHIVNCNDISDEQYASIITTIEVQFVDFDIPDIQDSKMVILIDNDIIQMNAATLNYMRTKYESSLFRFIRKHIKEYLDIMNDDLFVQEELVEILSWDIEDSYKMTLLSYSVDPISIIGKNYSLQICIHILNHNLQQADMISLYLSYNKQPGEIKEIVLKNAKKYIANIINDPCTAEESLKEDLLRANEISFEGKVHLLAAMIPNIGQTEVSKCLSILGLTDFIQIFDSHSRPKFEITDPNTELLDAFKQKKWIYEYLEDDNRPDYYRIRRREPKKAETVGNAD